MPLEHPHPGRDVAPRRWYRPAREPLPPEPGRIVVCALLARARRARGCTSAGDDRIETRLYAVKRYLFRLGHAARSARYATSIEQLVVGLAPVMGWGTPPRAGVERARFVRGHRRSVQRWLDDLQAAGLAAHEPERDERGRWWRTQIVLLQAAEPAADDRRAAERRARDWTARARRRRRATRSLEAIRRRSAAPDRRTRSRIALRRGLAAHQRRRQAVVQRCIAAASARREVLTHPSGAPPTSARSPFSAKPSRSFDAPRPAPTLMAPPSSAARTDARALAPDALDLRRAGERRSQERGWIALHTAHAAQRVAEVLAWPVGKPCPVGRLREAWVAHRHGLRWLAEGGTASAGVRSPVVEGRLTLAIRLYERFAATRPPDWPSSGPAALLLLASERRATTFAGDVSRLLILAKKMRAAAGERDVHRFRRQARRAARRLSAVSGPIAFRRLAQLESPEHRRQRIRDLVLLAGDDPARWPNAQLALEHGAAPSAGSPALNGRDRFEELDGVGARAARYRAELAQRRYRLAHPWQQLIPTEG